MSDAQFDLIIAGGSVRAACQAAHAAGLRVATIDLFADVDTSWYADEVIQLDRAGYPENLLPTLDRFDHSIPLMYTGGLENNPDLIEKIESQRTIWGSTSDTLRRVRDPFLLQRTLRRLGCPSLKTLSGTRRPTNGLWMHKPLHSVGGIGIQRINAHVQSIPKMSQDTYWQRYSRGYHFSAAFFVGQSSATSAHAAFQQLRTSITSNNNSALSVIGFAEPIRSCKSIYQGSLAQSSIGSTCRKTVVHLAKLLTEEFQLNGFFGIDMIANEKGIFVLEVNPRWTASVELMQQGSLKDWSGKQIVYANSDIHIPADWNWTPVSTSGIADLPQPGTLINAGEPLLTITGMNSSRKDLLASLSAQRREWNSRWQSAK